MKNAATDAIEREFPAWLVWLSQRGEFWGAVRRDPRADGDPTIITDSEDELREALSRQPKNAVTRR
jgi:hypothetical protein